MDPFNTSLPAKGGLDPSHEMKSWASYGEERKEYLAVSDKIDEEAILDTAKSDQGSSASHMSWPTATTRTVSPQGGSGSVWPIPEYNGRATPESEPAPAPASASDETAIIAAYNNEWLSTPQKASSKR